MFENHPNTPDGWLYIGYDKVSYELEEPGSYNLLFIDYYRVLFSQIWNKIRKSE